jgi:hypothetical protein
MFAFRPVAPKTLLAKNKFAVNSKVVGSNRNYVLRGPNPAGVQCISYPCAVEGRVLKPWQTTNLSPNTPGIRVYTRGICDRDLRSEQTHRCLTETRLKPGGYRKHHDLIIECDIWTAKNCLRNDHSHITYRHADDGIKKFIN